MFLRFLTDLAPQIRIPPEIASVDGVIYGFCSISEAHYPSIVDQGLEFDETPPQTPLWEGAGAGAGVGRVASLESISNQPQKFLFTPKRCSKDHSSPSRIDAHRIMRYNLLE